jgi:hypothetical protein
MSDSGPERKTAGCFTFLFILLPTSRRQSFNQNQTLRHPGPLANGKLPYPMPNDAISPQQLAPNLPALNFRRYR